MMTKIGKLLVLGNVFVSIGLLAWAVSIFTNRLAYFDYKDGETDVPGQYNNELKRLNDGAFLAQSLYVRAKDRQITDEQDRAYRLYILGIQMDEVKKPGNPSALFRDLPRHTEPELKGLVNVFTYGPNSPYPPRKNLRNQPLVGFGLLQQQMTNLVKESCPNPQMAWATLRA